MQFLDGTQVRQVSDAKCLSANINESKEIPTLNKRLRIKHVMTA